MNSDATYDALVVEQIHLYYLRSFRSEPAALNGAFLRIIDSFSRIGPLSGGEQQLLNTFLVQLMTAQERRDFVAIRDILWYEIKPFFENRTR